MNEKEKQIIAQIETVNDMLKVIYEEIRYQLQQKENIIKEIYAKANDTNITSLDLREYILDNLGGNK